MKLADWSYDNSITPAQLRRMLGVQCRSTVWRWLTNERIPQPPMMRKIEELTGGQVTLKDFLDPRPPACARWVTCADGTRRMRLPWSPDYGDDGGPPENEEDDDGFSIPVRRALRVLGDRARFTRRGTFLLDGRVTDLRRLVKKANELLKARGLPPIRYPGAGDDA
jgi:hypothetical protein